VRHWNWDEMVEANRGRLIGLLAGVVVLLGTGAMVPRWLKRQVIARLVPLESALRRLIVVAARDLPVPTGPGPGCPAGIPRGEGGTRKPVFRLTDPPRLPDPKPRTVPRRRAPRIRFFDERVPPDPMPTDDDLLDTAALRRRLEAMQAALDDLPAQARRLARWYGRRDRMRAAGRFSRLYTIRSGRPPGYRAKGKRDEDAVLAACTELALRVRAMGETERAAG